MVMVTAVEVRIHRKSPAQIFHFHAAPLETITTTSSLCDLLQHHFLQSCFYFLHLLSIPEDSITVLVCNGKHQYRARDDLDAFLVPHQEVEPRGSVWGRLGKPCDELSVHFGATKEALSLYFAKCGVVENVVILTDKVTGRPRGSSYITFAGKESLDKAVTLCGATFVSRIVKVNNYLSLGLGDYLIMPEDVRSEGRWMQLLQFLTLTGRLFRAEYYPGSHLC
ncbi:hypothetical protein QUC31_020956 [Theobroma cacao]